MLNTRFYKDRGTRFGTGYAKALTMTNGNFIMLYFNLNKVAKQQTISGFMFGLVGAMLTAHSAINIMKNNVCYIITPGQEKALIINDKRLKELLSDKQELLDEYLTTHKNDYMATNNIIPLLKEAGLIENQE